MASNRAKMQKRGFWRAVQQITFIKKIKLKANGRLCTNTHAKTQSSIDPQPSKNKEKRRSINNEAYFHPLHTVVEYHDECSGTYESSIDFVHGFVHPALYALSSIDLLTILTHVPPSSTRPNSSGYYRP